MIILSGLIVNTDFSVPAVYRLLERKKKLINKTRNPHYLCEVGARILLFLSEETIISGLFISIVT